MRFAEQSFRPIRGEREFIRYSISKQVRPHIRVLGRSLSAFQVCGCAGVALAIVLSMALVIHLSLSPSVMAALILSSMVTFLALTMATKIITGVESIIYYHHEIAVIVVAAVMLRLMHQPVLRYLDVTVLGIGIFLVCGRIGCLMVGCCHGRPHSWGVRYRQEHAAAGFTPYFVGVRLFPIQALESLVVLLIVIVGIAIIVSGHAPGEAFAWYVGAYALARFCFEFMRGDPERPYLLGFSEAQWTSLILMCGVLCAELSGAIIFHQWHLAATLCLASLAVAVALKRRSRKTAKHQIVHPRHVKEIAKALDLLSNLASESAPVSKWEPVASAIHIARTSLGVQISTSRIMTGAGFSHHYAFSCESESLPEESGAALAGLILLLRHPSDSSELLRGDRGVFHLLIDPMRQSQSARAQASTKSTEANRYAV